MDLEVFSVLNSEEMLDEISEMAESGIGEITIANNLGCPSSEWENLKSKYPDIGNAVTAGRHKGIEKVTKSLFMEAVDPGGSVSAKKAYLQVMDPSRWREVKEVKLQAEVKVGAITTEDANLVKDLFDGITK